VTEVDLRLAALVRAFERPGADVLFAPESLQRATCAAVVRSIGLPLNVRQPASPTSPSWVSSACAASHSAAAWRGSAPVRGDAASTWTNDYGYQEPSRAAARPPATHSPRSGPLDARTKRGETKIHFGHLAAPHQHARNRLEVARRAGS